MSKRPDPGLVAWALASAGATETGAERMHDCADLAVGIDDQFAAGLYELSDQLRDSVRTLRGIIPPPLSRSDRVVGWLARRCAEATGILIAVAIYHWLGAWFGG
jgi:hypothetical protein